jgi:hypothetical protein
MGLTQSSEISVRETGVSKPEEEVWQFLINVVAKEQAIDIISTTPHTVNYSSNDRKGDTHRHNYQRQQTVVVL